MNERGKTMLNETLRLVLTEGLRAYADLVEGNEADAKDKLRFMLADLERFFEADNGGPEAQHAHLFASPDCPIGYDTVVGYLAKYRPDLLELIADPLMDTRRDGVILARYCAQNGYPVHKVTAPEIFAGEGFTMLNAYPVEILKKRFGNN